MERMVVFGWALAFVGMSWLLSFLAASLLCSPALLKRLPRRHRFRLPSSDEARTIQEARTTKQVESEPRRCSVWLYLLLPIVAPMMIALLVLVLLPAFAAMGLCAVCMNYRYCRQAAYRSLRRRHAILSLCRSYPIGLAVFIRKLVSRCDTTSARC